jgi:Protein of unknown function (DUF3667)
MQTTVEVQSKQGIGDPIWTCVTCGHGAAGNFCARCGEKRRQGHDFSLGHVLAEAAEAFFHVDAKVFLTLKVLVTRPGQLTSEFFLGRRKPYMSPLQTFFVCNLLFFVLQPLTGLEILAPGLQTFENDTFFRAVTTRLIEKRLEDKRISRSDKEQFIAFSASFSRNAHLQAKSLILVMAPMLAVILAILNFRRRRYFSEHVIFSLHVYAWWLLWLLAILAVMGLAFVFSHLAGHQIGIYYIDYIATVLEFGGLGLYLFFASRRFYQERLIPGLIKGVALTLCGYGLFFLYRLLLLFTVLYST